MSHQPATLIALHVNVDRIVLACHIRGCEVQHGYRRNQRADDGKAQAQEDSHGVVGDDSAVERLVVSPQPRALARGGGHPGAQPEDDQRAEAEEGQRGGEQRLRVRRGAGLVRTRGREAVHLGYTGAAKQLPTWRSRYVMKKMALCMGNGA